MRRLYLVAVLIALMIPALHPACAADGVPDYSNTPRNEIPVESTWDLDDLFPNDEAWRMSFSTLQGRLPELRDLAATWTEDPHGALGFLRELESIEHEHTLLSKYTYLKNVAELSNPVYTSMSGEIRALGVEIDLVSSGLQEQVLSLGEARFGEFLAAESELEAYSFFIGEIFRGQAHALSQSEQRVADLTNLFTDAPVKIFNLLNDSEIPTPEIVLADGTEIALSRSAYYSLMASEVREDRMLASEAFWTNRSRFAGSLAASFDASCKQHLFAARIRGFDTSLEAALFQDEIDPLVYRNAIRQIRSRADLLQRYLDIKRRILGIESLSIEDTSINSIPGVDRRYTWDEAVHVVSQALEPLGRDYNRVVETAITERWIDRYPNKDKQSGAFSSPVYGVHPFIKLNYQGLFSDLGTLAHELGHAVQSHLSASHQPFHLHSEPPYVAEVASIFNEQLLSRYLLETVPDPRFRLALLDDYMTRASTVIFFGAILSELEVKMHDHVEGGATITGEFMNGTMLSLLRHYYGHDEGVCEVERHHEARWTVYPHLFMNFYLLAYSNGFIASTAAVEMLNEDPTYRDAYLEFLQAGGSAHALDLLKIAEIDLATEQPYDLAFQSIERVLGEMEILLAEIGIPEETRRR